MFREIILPIFRSTRLCVTACGVMHPPRCCRQQWPPRRMKNGDLSIVFFPPSRVGVRTYQHPCITATTSDKVNYCNFHASNRLWRWIVTIPTWPQSSFSTMRKPHGPIISPINFLSSDSINTFSLPLQQTHEIRRSRDSFVWRHNAN